MTNMERAFVFAALMIGVFFLVGPLALILSVLDPGSQLAASKVVGIVVAGCAGIVFGVLGIAILVSIYYGMRE